VPDFDAIVVGSGISGGWVAKELCERGLKVLLLERGKEIDPAKDYADMADPWEKKHFDEISQQQLKQDLGKALIGRSDIMILRRGMIRLRNCF